VKVLDFLPIARAVASLSKDPRTKVGAVILGPAFEIRSTGWNGFPRHVGDFQDRWTIRETKYRYVCHAEANAITNAARMGTPLDNCILLVTGLFPCQECAKLIIQSGIASVFVPDQDIDPAWEDSFQLSREMFREAGVALHFYDPDFDPQKIVDNQPTLF
jgi:dCMP deaminase